LFKLTHHENDQHHHPIPIRAGRTRRKSFLFFPIQMMVSTLPYYALHSIRFNQQRMSYQRYHE